MLLTHYFSYTEAEVAVSDESYSNQAPIDPRSMMINVVAPAVASAATLVGGVYVATRAFQRRQDNLVAQFASEMVYHSNNLDEVRGARSESSERR